MVRREKSITCQTLLNTEQSKMGGGSTAGRWKGTSEKGPAHLGSRHAVFFLKVRSFKSKGKCESLAQGTEGEKRIKTLPGWDWSRLGQHGTKKRTQDSAWSAGQVWTEPHCLIFFFKVRKKGLNVILPYIMDILI